MNVAKERQMKRQEEYKNTASNQNDPLLFGIQTAKDLVKLLLWVLVGANFFYLTFNYCNPVESIYQKEWPYNLKDSNMVFAWFGKTLITSWHSSRYIFKAILDYTRTYKKWQQTAIVFLSPIIVLAGIFAVPILGFLTTFYGAYRYGSDSCNQDMYGIIISIILFFTGILFMFCSTVGMIQAAYFFIAVLIIPLTKDKGLANVSNMFYENKGKISFIFSLFVIMNAYKYLNSKIAIGMIIAFIISVILQFVMS